jgi:GTP-binding protein
MSTNDRPIPPVAVASDFLGSGSNVNQLPATSAVEVAFAGRSNVGKSTLLNLLLSRKLAHTSSAPGRTRTLNFFSVKTRGGSVLTLVDLPGYGFARRPKEEKLAWADLAERYLLERPALALVVVLVDARRGPEDDDLDLLKMMKDSKKGGRAAPQVLVVATKLDKLPLAQRKPALAKIASGGTRVIGVSASDPASIDGLWRRLLSALGLEQNPTAT